MNCTQNEPVTELQNYDPEDYLQAIFFDSDGSKCGSRVVTKIELKAGDKVFFIEHCTSDEELLTLKDLILSTIDKNVNLNNFELWLFKRRDLCRKNYEDQI